jgi:hypothetical protein
MMDPNETLRLIRSAVAASLQLADDYEKSGDDYPATAEDAGNYIDQLDELAQQVEALDQWLTRGGFLPEAWNVPEVGGRTVAAALTAARPPEKLEDLGLVHPAWQTDVQEAAAHHDRQLLGPPDPAHADASLIDQLDDELHRAGEIVRRMREGH